MKLLYATSFRGTSGLANRVQVLAMAKAFARALPGSFQLGTAGIERAPADISIVNFKTRRSWQLAREYLKFARAHGIDVIYSREGRILFFLLLYKAFFYRARIKIVYEIHALSHGSWLERLIEWALSRWAHALIFVTAHLRDRYVKRYGIALKKTFVSPDGVDIDLFDISINKNKAREKLELPLDKMIIGYCGRFQTMGMEKGLEDVLKALHGLPAEVIFVAMGGKPRHVDYYAERARAWGVADRAIFRGHFTQETVALYQKAADMLVMPFPWTEHYAYEMSPMKMFEYMASKRPILTTDLPSVREILNEKNALFCKPNNPKDLAAKIRMLVSNCDLGNRLAEEAHKDAVRYTWKKRAKSVLDFLSL
jgi:glycosyltransferase involved in cell wall biosynthesis